jgi:regulator of replication initiation timing
MMKNAIATNKVEMFGGVFTAFASLATAQGGADNELLEQLVNILNNLKEAVEENWEARTVQEAGFQADYETLKSTLDNTITSLVEETHTLEREIGSLKKCIVFQTGIVGSATAKKDRNQNLWDDATELCDNADDEYNSAKALRQEELEVIDQLRHKVNLRWG